MNDHRMALTFATRPGTHEEAGQALLRAFPAPVPSRPGSPVTGAATFVRPGRVVQVIDTTLPLDDLVRALHEEPHAQRLADRLRGYCEPVVTAPGAPLYALLSGGLMRRWAHMRGAAPAGAPPVHHRALWYPVRPGHGEALARTLGAGVAPGTPAALAAGLVSSTIFARDDVVIRFWEATASADDELRHISRIVPRSGLGARLNELLDVPDDLTTEAGFRSVFTRHGMHPALQQERTSA